MRSVTRGICAVGVAAALLTAAGCGTSGPHRPGGSSATTSGSTPPTSVTPTTGGSSAPSSSARPTTSPAPTHTTPHPTRTTPSPTRTTPTRTPTPTGVPSWLAGRDWERIPTSRHVVALTFDAGGDDAGVASILATLAREHVPATFYLTGNWVHEYPARARAIAAAHRVGDHSVDHPYLTTYSDAAIRREVLDAATAIRTVTGANPAPLFRFPYGDTDARTIAAVNSVGYVPVRWTVDTLGWKGTSGGQSADSVLARVLAGLQPGEIVLMHVGSNPKDGTTLDAAALPRMISALRAKGYGFVTLDALVG